jgi:hypothetical protein
MPNAFGTNEYGWQIIAAFVVLAILVVVGYTVWPTPSLVCPPRLHRSKDGSLRLEPSGPEFPDMNAFQKWWHASRDYANCPLPVLTGARRAHETLREESSDEQMYAKTPIYKVDDYEFSRVFGYERNGHMDVPRQNYNIILNQRAFDWPDKPLSSDERRAKYKGLHEGFTAAGDLKSIVMSEPSAEDLVKEAVSRYGEKRHRRPATVDVEEDVDCRVSREAKEVADMVAKAYESDPNYEPVITKVGANHWEVNELKPRRRHVAYEEQGNDKVVDTGNDAVDIEFQYRENRVNEEAIDPFFLATGDLPFQSERLSHDAGASDPWYGPVPGMERMFGPTFDHKNWY